MEVKKNGSMTSGLAQTLKITLVGDSTVGKTCMLFNYLGMGCWMRRPTDSESNVSYYMYIPSCAIDISHSSNITVDDQLYNLSLWDTVGDHEHHIFRPHSYHNTDCFLLCYSVDKRGSFENIVNQWQWELKTHCPKVPIVLVATKTDLRNKEGVWITTKEGEKLKRKIKASRFVECSALNNEGLEEVFIEAVRAILLSNSRLCVCL